MKSFPLAVAIQSTPKFGVLEWFIVGFFVAVAALMFYILYVKVVGTPRNLYTDEDEGDTHYRGESEADNQKAAEEALKAFVDALLEIINLGNVILVHDTGSNVQTMKNQLSKDISEAIKSYDGFEIILAQGGRGFNMFNFTQLGFNVVMYMAHKFGIVELKPHTLDSVFGMLSTIGAKIDKSSIEDDKKFIENIKLLFGFLRHEAPQDELKKIAGVEVLFW